jgi:hypothetical protein
MKRIIAMIFAVLLAATFVSYVGDGYATAMTGLNIHCSCR